MDRRGPIRGDCALSSLCEIDTRKGHAPTEASRNTAHDKKSWPPRKKAMPHLLRKRQAGRGDYGLLKVSACTSVPPQNGAWTVDPTTPRRYSGGGRYCSALWLAITRSAMSFSERRKYSAEGRPTPRGLHIRGTHTPGRVYGKRHGILATRVFRVATSSFSERTLLVHTECSVKHQNLRHYAAPLASGTLPKYQPRASCGIKTIAYFHGEGRKKRDGRCASLPATGRTKY